MTKINLTKGFINYNEERHFGNFGVLRDNHTGKNVAPAPISDNGLSLFCFAGREDLPTLAEYAKTRTNPYYISFEVEHLVAVERALENRVR